MFSLKQKLSPINARRLESFKANRRGYISFIILFSAYLLSFASELVFNEKPLIVRFKSELHFPILFTYSEKDYGGDFDSQADYRDKYVQELIQTDGWILFPPFPYSYDTIITDLDTPAPSPPSRANWLGTDDQSRDVLTRLVYGFRLSMSFGLLLSVFALIAGISAGAIQGYFGGWIDLAFQRFLEMWESIPGLYLLIILSSIVVPSFFSLLVIMSLTAWIGYVGVVRAEFLRIRGMDYVRAGEAMGLNSVAIMFRHILPNAVVATVTFLPFNLSAAVTALASLDFLGFGLPPPAPSLGEIIYQGKNNLHAPWLGLTGFFTLATMLVLLIFAAEALRDAFNYQKTNLGKDNDDKKTSSKNMAKAKAIAESISTSPASLQASSQSTTKAKTKNAILQIRNLSVSLTSNEKRITAVKDASLTVPKGKTLALVGESGSGKSMLALSVLRLQSPSLQCHIGGSIVYDGQEINSGSKSDEKTVAKLRRNRVGMIFQDPLSSLNPVQTIGTQLMESIRLAKNGTQPDNGKWHDEAKTLLRSVELHDASRFLQNYPAELSGGQRQRVMIAMAMAKKPELLIADEPTTALDVTVQAEIIDLLKRKQAETGLSILFITHDLGLVQRMADSIAVMQYGKIVEENTAKKLFKNPRHPYTRVLLDNNRNLNIRYQQKSSKKSANPVLEVKSLEVRYPLKSSFLRRTTGYINALNDTSFTLKSGQTMGVIGESGSGKSTLAQAILRLISSKGQIILEGDRLDGKNARELQSIRCKMQVIFQDPYSSLSPRQSVFDIVSEGLSLHFPHLSQIEKKTKVKAVLQEVGLPQEVGARYPHEFSGGERQRIALARALILRPKLLLLDEPTSSLDVSLQKRILDLILQLQEKYAMAYVFISHDIKVIRALADFIVVMKEGNIVEMGSAKKILTAPQNAYTRKLISAAMI